METDPTDALVIGLGLAGVAVVHALQARGCSFTVVDTPLPDAGSPVAAGLMLPITGPRWVLRPHYEALLTAARTVYGDRMVPLRMTRLLSEPGDPFLEKRRSDKAYDRVLGDWTPATSGPLRDGHGSVSWTGHHVDVPAFLATQRERLLASGHLVEREVHLSDIRVDDMGVTYDGRRYRWLVLCTGHRAIGVPPFDWLRYRPARGEWAELEPIRGLDDGVYERRHWLLQRGGRSCVGSTYDWSDLHAGVTEEGRRALEQAASSLVSAPVRVVGQHAGIRAPTMDRWPYAGVHPEGKRVALLAGLGGTGLLTAPWCAQALVARLFDESPLPSFVDLARRGKDRGVTG